MFRNTLVTRPDSWFNINKRSFWKKERGVIRKELRKENIEHEVVPDIPPDYEATIPFVEIENALYVAKSYWNYDGENILGIFSTYEAAAKKCDENLKHLLEINGWFPDGYYIAQFVLDKPEYRTYHDHKPYRDFYEEK